jgi:hypothetical protein
MDRCAASDERAIGSGVSITPLVLGETAEVGEECRADMTDDVRYQLVCPRRQGWSRVEVARARREELGIGDAVMRALYWRSCKRRVLLAIWADTLTGERLSFGCSA